MINDATGTALIIATSGLSSSSTRVKRAESAAHTTPSAHESKNPPKMCAPDSPTVRQKAAVTQSSNSFASEATGEGSSKAPCGNAAFSAILPACHTIIQNTTAQAFMRCFPFGISSTPLVADCDLLLRITRRSRCPHPAYCRPRRRGLRHRAPASIPKARPSFPCPSGTRCCSRAVPFPQRRHPLCRNRR